MDYEERIEGCWENFMEGVREFAQKGDERDSVVCFEEDTKVDEVESEIKADRSLAKAYRKRLLRNIEAKKKEAKKIEGLAEDHRMEMQRHTSGSSYYRALADFEESIGL